MRGSQLEQLGAGLELQMAKAKGSDIELWELVIRHEDQTSTITDNTPLPPVDIAAYLRRAEKKRSVVVQTFASRACVHFLLIMGAAFIWGG